MRGFRKKKEKIQKKLDQNVAQIKQLEEMEKKNVELEATIQDKKIGLPLVTKKVKVIPYAQRLAKVKTYVMCISEGLVEKCLAKIKDEWFLEFKPSGYKKKQIFIASHPDIFEYSGGRPLSRKREIVFFAGIDAEATHPPGLCKYNLPQLEAISKNFKAVTGTAMKEVLAKAVKGKKGFWELFPIIAIVLVVAIFVFGG